MTVTGVTGRMLTIEAASVGGGNIEVHRLDGLNVVFTGKMQMPRDEARKAVIRIGGFAPKGLTQDTDYLVVGVQDLRVVGESGLSSKMKTAQKYREKGLPIEVISEADFLEMIQY